VLDAGAQIIAFGKVQEAEEKLPLLEFSGETHFIGRLQKNKVKRQYKYSIASSRSILFRWQQEYRMNATRSEKKYRCSCK
jgi:uncharacterized pyridoxal phosphate-containing UPF0001 family protein